MSDDDPLAEQRVAAVVAPIVDRLRIGIARRLRERMAPVVAGAGGDPTLVRTVGMLRNALPDRAVPREGFATVFVYEPDAPAMVDRALESGYAEDAGGGLLRLTRRGGELVEDLRRITGEIVEELWSAHADRCAALAPLAGRLLDSASATGGPTFAVLAPPYEPAGTPTALLLAERLTPLRFHRFDAHVAAWRRAGLTAEQARSLPPGQERDAIEADTNRRAGAPFAVLDRAERLAFCAGLGALPG